jgi:hypothetical protein
VLGRLAAAEQRLCEAEQSGLEQVAAARRLEAEKEELAERLAAAQVEIGGLEAQLEVARLELEEKVLKLGTKIQVRHRINILLDVTVPYIAISPSFVSNRYRDKYNNLLTSAYRWYICRRERRLRIVQQCQLRNLVLYRTRHLLHGLLHAKIVHSGLRREFSFWRSVQLIDQAVFLDFLPYDSAMLVPPRIFHANQIKATASRDGFDF